MIKRLVLAAAAALTLGAFVAAPAPAQAASIATPAGAAQLNVQAASDVVQVRRRWRRHRGHHHGWRHHRRWRAPHFAYRYYARPRCGYVVRPHRGRVVYRCW